MSRLNKTLLILFLFFFGAYCQSKLEFPWLDENSGSDYPKIINIPLPEGYQRLEYSHNTFQEWLRHLPLKINQDKVHLYDKKLKSNQAAHFKIIDIDVGDRDLQQCADAIIRLYAEYLYSQDRYDDISFNFTNGDEASFKSWANGLRPIVNNNIVKWEKLDNYNISYKNFRKYLMTVFTYAGSYSLAKEMIDIKDISDLQIGDVFLQGGFPGHGIIIVDLAINVNSGEKIFMIAQSYMPAQDIHILKNLENDSINPWYMLESTNKLYTPEWTFEWKDLKRFDMFYNLD